MNVAMHGRITAQDVVRVERLKDELIELADKVDALETVIRNVAISDMEKARKVVTNGAKLHAEPSESAAEELEREIALARAQLQALRWKDWWSGIERQLADVEAAFAEFRVRQQLGLALDCCSE